MLYTIKEFANKFKTTEHTIRYYTDIGLLPCERDKQNRRVFNDESINWMTGISCLKGCGASIEDIKEYCELCKQPSSKENLQARFKIILKQKEKAYEQLENAKYVVDYMEKKVEHYNKILNGDISDDTNPNNWRTDNRPKLHK